MPDLRSVFGHQLRQWREIAGIRLGDFARQLGVTPAHLSDVELGNRRPFGGRRLEETARLLRREPAEVQVLAAQAQDAFVLAAVCVTGGRSFSDARRIDLDLRALVPLGLRRVAQGGNGIDEQYGHERPPRRPRSADTLAWLASGRLDLETATYRVNRNADERGTWNYLDGHGAWAPLRRNTRMVQAERPDLGLGYPDENSSGTWHCIAEMLKLGIPVVVWMPWSNEPCAFAARKIQDRAPSMLVGARELLSGHVAVRAVELTTGPWPALLDAVEGVLRV